MTITIRAFDDTSRAFSVMAMSVAMAISISFGDFNVENDQNEKDREKWNPSFHLDASIGTDWPW